MKEKQALKINLKNINYKSIINALNFLEKKPHVHEIQKQNQEIKALIEIKNLKKSYGVGNNKKDVLKDINLTIKNNENLALLGANGAGKTTLVEIIVGLNKATSGKINYLYPFAKTFQESLGIQFQDSSYPSALTVKEILEFMIQLFGCDLNKDELNSLIKIFGIDEYYKKRASKLSGGQQQRLNVLLALIHKPKIIILDELSTGLDISIRTRIKNFIYEFSLETNMTIILISHDMGEISQLCKRIVFLKDGVIVKDLQLEQIIKEYQSLETFVEQMLK